MRYGVTLKGLIVAAAACMTAACGGGDAVSGDPAPTRSSAASTNDLGLPKHGAPGVEKPLDTSALAADACTAVTKQQLESLAGHLGKKEPVTVDARSPYCSWNFQDPDTGFQFADIGAGLNLEKGANGLSTIYERRQSGDMTIFRPTQVQGYPAVFYSAGLDLPGKCVMAVGVSNDTVYVVNVDTFDSHPKSDNPCSITKKFAGYVVQNLKEG